MISESNSEIYEILLFLDPVAMAAWHKIKRRALLRAVTCLVRICTAQGDTDSATCCGSGLVLLGSYRSAKKGHPGHFSSLLILEE